MSENTLNLLKKLKALADGGVGGEKYNAQRALDKFLAKNNITLADLEDNQVKEFSFKKVQDKYTHIFFGIVVNVVTDSKNYYVSKSFYWINCTESQKVEINLKFAFYKRVFDQQLKTFTIAFVHKNGLTRKVESLSDLTEEEAEEMRKAKRMASGMEQAQYHKQLTRYPK